MSSRDWERASQLPWKRSVQVRTMMRPLEVRELEMVAKDWGVPVGTAVWGIVAQVLSDARGRSPELGSLPAEIASALWPSHRSSRLG